MLGRLRRRCRRSGGTSSRNGASRGGRRRRGALDEYDAVWLFGGVVNTHEEERPPVAARGEPPPPDAARPRHADARRLPGRSAHRQGRARGGNALTRAGDRLPSDLAHARGRLRPALRRPARAADGPAVALLLLPAPGGSGAAGGERRLSQAYRLGDLAWGLQFHLETTREDGCAGSPTRTRFPASIAPASTRTCCEPRSICTWRRGTRSAARSATRFLAVAERADRLSVV